MIVIAFIVLVVFAFLVRMFPVAVFVGGFILFLIVAAIMVASGHG